MNEGLELRNRHLVARCELFVRRGAAERKELPQHLEWTAPYARDELGFERRERVREHAGGPGALELRLGVRFGRRDQRLELGEVLRCATASAFVRALARGKVRKVTPKGGLQIRAQATLLGVEPRHE